VVSTINATPTFPFSTRNSNTRHQGQDIPVVAFSSVKKNSPAEHQAAARPSGRLELLPVDQGSGQREVHQGMADLHQEPEARDQRSDGSALIVSTCGSGVEKGEVDRRRQGDRRAARHRAKNLTGGTSKMLPTTTSPSRCSLANQGVTVRFRRVWRPRRWPAMHGEELDGSKEPDRRLGRQEVRHYNTKTNKCGGQGSLISR